MRRLSALEPEHRAVSECIICHFAKPNGIRICGEFICADCEQDIVHANVDDAVYQHYVQEMKRIWISALSL